MTGTTPEVVMGPVGPDDAEEVGGFQTRCWQEAYRGILADAFLDALDVRERISSWRRRIERREREVVAARRDGRIVGVVSWTPGPVYELNTLYVDLEARGTGLAATLLYTAIGDRPAGLWVFRRNELARRFYAKQGFAQTVEQQRDDETGEPEVRMTRLREGSVEFRLHTRR